MIVGVPHEIKADVKETKESVQLILRKLDAMEASRAAEAKAARERARRERRSMHVTVAVAHAKSLSCLCAFSMRSQVMVSP